MGPNRFLEEVKAGFDYKLGTKYTQVPMTSGFWGVKSIQKAFNISRAHVILSCHVLCLKRWEHGAIFGGKKWDI